MSRLFVRNLPKNLTESDFKAHFSKMGDVTDARIQFKEGQHRRFGFIGYRTEEIAQKALKYFNNTYIFTSKIIVSIAESVDQQKEKLQKKHVIKTEKEQFQPVENNFESESKRAQFQEFINLMKGGTNQMSDNIVVEDKKPQKKVKKEQHKEILQTVKEIYQKTNPIKQIQTNIKVDAGQLIDDKRLFVLNLPFNTSDEEVMQAFSKYGKVESIKMPKGSGGVFKGFAYITYSNAEEAIRAFAEMDNKIVLGRYLHIRPAYKEDKDISVTTQTVQEKSSFKTQKKVDLMKNLKDETNWNTLFLNPNTVLQYIANKFGLTKAELLSQDHNDQAVKVALAETEVLNETKEWLLNQGISLDFMNSSRQTCPRSQTTILVKNLPATSTVKGLKELFEHYGSMSKFSLSPNKALALVSYSNEAFASNAFQNLSYYVYKNEPLYLEWAPSQMDPSAKLIQQPQEVEQNDSNAKILFVKNLNFLTSDETFKAHFEKEKKSLVSAKIVRRENLSQGYGFVEFKNSDDVDWFLKNRQNSILDNHSLKLSVSKQSQENQKQNNRKQKVNYLNQKSQNQMESTKIVVRNIAFEATKEDILSLFKNYAEIKTVRMPKKADGNHRGFAFIDCMTIEEANKAFTSLQHSHLYGRKLNFEWAQQINADQMVKLN